MKIQWLNLALRRFYLIVNSIFLNDIFVHILDMQNFRSNISYHLTNNEDIWSLWNLSQSLNKTGTEGHLSTLNIEDLCILCVCVFVCMHVCVLPCFIHLWFSAPWTFEDWHYNSTCYHRHIYSFLSWVVFKSNLEIFCKRSYNVNPLSFMPSVSCLLTYRLTLELGFEKLKLCLSV
jgi:hypothetical protein